MSKSIEERVIEILTEDFNNSDNAIKVSNLLQEDIGMDSLDIIESVVAFEDEFSIDISDDAIADCKTVQDVINTITKLVG